MTFPRPAPVERLVFEHTIEALFVQGLRGRLTPDGMEKLKAVGLDLRRPLLPAYAADCFRDAAKVAAVDCFPGHSVSEAFHALGERTVLGMEETLFGRAAWAMARLIGPRRTLLRMPQNIRGGSNYTDARAEELGPARVRLTMTGYVFSTGDFMRGNLTGTLQMLQVASGRAEVVSLDAGAETIVVDASW